MKIFGTDGVRGAVGDVLTPQLAFSLGQAAGQVLVRSAEASNHAPTCVIGRDSRLSGQMLEAALTAGLTSVGLNVISCGLVPTPAVAYLVRSYHALAGAVISASHNPFEDNGIKFFNAAGQKLTDAQEADIEALLASDAPIALAKATDFGRIMHDKNGLVQYTRYLKSLALTDAYRFHVVIDCANGSASPVAGALFSDLGVRVQMLSDTPDGININDNCGSTHPEHLQEQVLAWGADLGFAFDGDADRFLAVDHTGRLIDGDRLMAIFARYLKQTGRLKNNTFVATVMSNMGLKLAMAKEDIQLIEAQVGDRFVNAEMQTNGLNLGGEQSGHIIFSDLNATGDGLISAIMLLNVMFEEGKRLADLADIMETLPQVLVNVRVRDKHAWQSLPAITTAIAAVESALAGEGRVLVRASGTEELLRVMVEGRDQDNIEAMAEGIAQIVRQELGA